MTKKPILFSALVVAGGSGRRFGNDIPKQYTKLMGKDVLRHSLDLFLSMPGLQDLRVVIDPRHEDLYKASIAGLDLKPYVSGGEERKDSVYNGLKAFSHLKVGDIILIHDAARPLVTEEAVLNLLEVVKVHKAASLAWRIPDTMVRADLEEEIGEFISRERVWGMQTPQAFHYGLLRHAHESADRDRVFTDDTGLVSALGQSVRLVDGGKTNFKITLEEDLAVAEAILKQTVRTDQVMETRTGMGFDVHRFENYADEKGGVRLCGIDIPHPQKLEGHSDADAALHALTDAILGAIGGGDIGIHFPPSNMKFKGMDSAFFVKEALRMMKDKGGVLVNTDLTLLCEAPKIMPHREKILLRLAEILEIDKERINVKATTMEKLGFIGRREGIAAQAVVTVSLPAAA